METGPIDVRIQDPKAPSLGKILHEGGLGKSTKLKRWIVQCNVHASNKVREHVVEWVFDGSKNWQGEDTSGCGSGIDFVASLNAGDRIGLFARAMVCTQHHILD
jgi:hypothetical protein